MDRIVAVNSNCYHGFSLEEAIPGIRAAGFRYIELTATKGWTEHVFPTMSLRALWEIRDALRDAELSPFAMSGHCSLMDNNRLADFIANIRLAGFFGSRYIVSAIGEAHLEDQAHADKQTLVKNIRSFLPYLEEFSLKLSLEVHGKMHGSGRALRDIAEQVDSPLVGVNYDTANALFYGDVNLAEDLAYSMDRINYMHWKDKAGARDEWNFPALGEGYVDFPMVLGQLEAAGNGAPLSIEIEFTQAGPKDLAEVNRAVAASMTYLQGLGIGGL